MMGNVVFPSFPLSFPYVLTDPALYHYLYEEILENPRHFINMWSKVHCSTLTDTMLIEWLKTVA